MSGPCRATDGRGRRPGPEVHLDVSGGWRPLGLLVAWVWRPVTMTVGGLDLDLSRATRMSPRQWDVRAPVTSVLRRGAAWTALFMVLPGLLSSRPVEDSLTGAGVGLSATLLIALGVYVWLSYVAPYRRVRSLIANGAPAPATAVERGAWAVER